MKPVYRKIHLRSSYTQPSPTSYYSVVVYYTDMTPALQAALSTSKASINTFLSSYLNEKIEEAQHIDTHLAQAATLLKEQSLSGGKKVRGALCMLSYALAGGKEDVIHSASGIELIHQYLCTLDDMADRDVIRHGIPTLEKMYEKTLTTVPSAQRDHYARSFTEIAAALLHTYAYELFASSPFPDSIKLEVIHLVNTILLRDTAAGWFIHMTQNWQSLTDASEQEFEKGLRLVTAQYTFVGPLLIGITLAGKRKELESALTEYGMHVGTAFQMHDDILGIFGDTQVTGKGVGNDIREGKKTLLLQYAYAHSTSDQKTFLEHVVGSPLSKQDLHEVQEIMKSTGALAYAQEKAAHHIRSGILALEKLSESPEKQLLIQLAEYIIAREK